MILPRGRFSLVVCPSVCVFFPWQLFVNHTQTIKLQSFVIKNLLVLKRSGVAGNAGLQKVANGANAIYGNVKTVKSWSTQKQQNK